MARKLARGAQERQMGAQSPGVRIAALVVGLKTGAARRAWATRATTAGSPPQSAGCCFRLAGAAGPQRPRCSLCLVATATVLELPTDGQLAGGDVVPRGRPRTHPRGFS